MTVNTAKCRKHILFITDVVVSHIITLQRFNNHHMTEEVFLGINANITASKKSEHDSIPHIIGLKFQSTADISLYLHSVYFDRRFKKRNI